MRSSSLNRQGLLFLIVLLLFIALVGCRHGAGTKAAIGVPYQGYHAAPPPTYRGPVTGTKTP